MVEQSYNLKSNKSNASSFSKKNNDPEHYISKDLLGRLDIISPFCSRERSSKAKNDFVISNFNADGISRFSLGTLANNITMFNSLDKFFRDNVQNLKLKVPIFLEGQLHEDSNVHYVKEDFWTLNLGKSGWVCSECNNFNYESRRKCNKCSKHKSNDILGEKQMNILDFYEKLVIF